MQFLAICAVLLAAELLDRAARPRGWRRFATWPGRAALSLAALGAALALTGNLWLSSAITLALEACICVGSNLKFRLLGEPLIFSDFAVAGAFFRFPALYLYAVPWGVRIAVAAGLCALAAALVAGFSLALAPHLLGAALFAGACAVLTRAVAAPWLGEPDLLRDVARHGVKLTLLLYWRRWRRPAPAHPALPADPVEAELIVLVQCESFADPAEIAPAVPQPELPSLALACAQAWASGALEVSGFGAYTMRTEFGVLCGVEEAALGFARYDPFLTGARQAAVALPARLPSHHACFVHPYDLRFFGRDRLMPALGFRELRAAHDCPPPERQSGPYTGDAALGDMLARRIAAARGPELLYVVTMENHGPWGAGRLPGVAPGLPMYFRHLQQGDALLGRLMEALAASRRPAVLAFFGDHRPSIPGIVEDGPRHTPYVLLRYQNGEALPGPGRMDLTPAALHHAILRCAAAPGGARHAADSAVES